MLMPKKQKYRKAFKGKNRGTAQTGDQLAYGSFGLQSLDNERINSRQIESARRAITRSVKRGGKIWIRIFPHIPVTGKALGTKMGSGKGNPEFYVARVKTGTMLFEMDGVTEEVAREAMLLASNKLPVRTRFIQKHVTGGGES